MSRVPDIPPPETINEMARDLDALEACRTEAEISAWLAAMNARPQTATMKGVIEAALAEKRRMMAAAPTTEAYRSRP
jgi:hypothetical protein